ncbi:hypothetical protein GCM10027037_22640 [Mucilaginibacter koreensis]
MNTTYKASYDTTVRWVSTAYGIITLIPLTLTLTGRQQDYGMVTAGLVLIGTVVFLFSVKNYSLSANGIVINKYIGSKTIWKADIKQIKVLGPEHLSGTLRTFGVGGLFGYYGKFANQQLGDMTWYLTNKDHVLAIITKNNRTLLISPDEAVRFYQQWVNEAQVA